MDRFIVIADVADDESVLHLKSNMDRFIAMAKTFTSTHELNLKSNMDRFIDKAAVMYIWQFGVFKIQYG